METLQEINLITHYFPLTGCRVLAQTGFYYGLTEKKFTFLPFSFYREEICYHLAGSQYVFSASFLVRYIFLPLRRRLQGTVFHNLHTHTITQLGSSFLSFPGSFAFYLLLFSFSSSLAPQFFINFGLFYDLPPIVSFLRQRVHRILRRSTFRYSIQSRSFRSFSCLTRTECPSHLSKPIYLLVGILLLLMRFLYIYILSKWVLHIGLYV